jgi:Methyltransferase domain
MDRHTHGTIQAMDWDNWHKLYETSEDFRTRLRMVCQQISAVLDRCPDGPIRIISICAGDGRDVLEAVSEHHRCGDVQAFLLDNHAASLERGQRSAEKASMSENLHFMNADASLASSFTGLGHADLVLISGVLGHLDHADVPRLITKLPMLVKKGGSVIWTRHLKLHDGGKQIPSIRKMFLKSHFQETFFGCASPEGFVVVCDRFCGNQTPLDGGQRLFDFIGLTNFAPRPTLRKRLKNLFGKKKITP